jgi:ribosomal protein L28
MALRCDVCDKKTVHGNTQLHRHSRWRFRAPKTKRTWVPNIRNLHIEAQNGSTDISICMSCYKKYQQDGNKFLIKKNVKAVKKLDLTV